MTYLLLTVALFALAAGINTASVGLEQNRGWLTHRFGRYAWPVHLLLISPAWALFLFVLSQLGGHVHWLLPAVLQPLGWLVLGAAVLLFLASLWQLGLRRTLNGYFFGAAPSTPISGGLYRWLDNPMYHSYWLAFVGTALAQANAAYLVLAAASFLLLNRCEAKVENRPLQAAS